MSTSIKKVAWIGTGGNGKPLLQIVAASQKFDIVLLVRKPLATYAGSVPESVAVKQVDFESHAALVSAFQGIDAVVSVMTFGPLSDIDIVELRLINAAIEAGVKFFIPSEWAPDSAGADITEEPWIGKTLRPNSIIAPKRVVHNYLLARAGQGKIAFAIVYTGVIIPSSFRVGMLAFDFEKKIALLPDNGVSLFPATTLETTGAAVVAILTRAFSPEVKNRFLHISDFTTSQSEILSIIEETLDGEPWTRINVPMKGFFHQSISNIEDGTCTAQEFGGVLIPPFFGGIDVWAKEDNEQLGLAKKMSLRDEVSKVARTLSAKARRQAA